MCGGVNGWHRDRWGVPPAPSLGYTGSIAFGVISKLRRVRDAGEIGPSPASPIFLTLRLAYHMNTTETTRPSEHAPLTTDKLAAQLGETEPIPRKHLKRALRILGPEPTQALLDQTMETERNGGLMLSDGSRRRTPGGVFFHLIRTTVGTKESYKILRPQTKPTPAQPQDAGADRSSSK